MTSGCFAFCYEAPQNGTSESGLNALQSGLDGVHVGFRPAQQKLVLNTRFGGQWGKQREIAGSPDSGYYELKFSAGGKLSLSFANRELVSISSQEAKGLFENAPFAVTVYGDILLLGVDGKLKRGTAGSTEVVHGIDSVLLRALRASITPQQERAADSAQLRHEDVATLLQSLQSFDRQRYLDLNPDLSRVFETAAEALAHFVSAGIAELRPFDANEIFDHRFYRDRYEDVAGLTPARAYLHWLSRGRKLGRAPRENVLLRQLGLTISSIPGSFSLEACAEALGVEASALRSKWDGFEQLIAAIPRTSALLAPMQENSVCAQIYKDIADSFARRNENTVACELYWRALVLDPDRLDAWQHLGDALLRSARFAEARHAYLCAGKSGYYYSRRNLIEADRGMQRTHEALKETRALATEHPEKLDLQELYAELSDQVFEAERLRAKSLACAGFRQEAVAVMRAAFQPVEELNRALPVSSRTAHPRIIIFGTPYLAQCSFYRVEQKLEQLAQSGFEAEFISQDDPDELISRIPTTDLVIFYRVPALPGIERAILECRKAGVPTICEMDDLVFDPEHFPDSIDNYRGQLPREEYANLVVDAPMFERTVSLCDYGLASTTVLQRLMETRVVRRQCFLHRNMMDSRHQRFAMQYSGADQDEIPGKVTVFCASGSKAHKEDFELYCVPVLADLFRQHAGLRLVLMGYFSLPAELAAFRDRIRLLPPVWDINSYWSALSEADINISVLKPSLLSDSKSEIKWLEAAMLGIPSIVSATANYSEVLQDGMHVMLADALQSWREKLSALLSSAALRSRIGANAANLARLRYSPDAGAENIQKIVQTVLEERRQTRSAAKPLVLIVNVFFWPQMIGGATRVVRDNLDSFGEFASDEFDFEVFCASEGARHPYQVRHHDYNGIPVTSVTHPMREHMDWQPADEEMGRIFRDHIERRRPSLIHFHCIQRLSVCVVEAAQKLGIPYVVTVHDGWWISDHQFLVDEHGKPVPAHCEDSIEVLQKGGEMAGRRVNRAIRLRAALLGANAILSVSTSFETVYRYRGITQRISTVANGVSALRKARRCPSADGRIRLGYLGGISEHKGYGLIQRALLSTPFERLSLTVVDHSLPFGAIMPTQTWGTTPVRMIGKFPQERVVDLYENLDVLLAPSIWPESFGLVAREALMCGLWVVASDRGAIADDVIPGANGFVVDVSNTLGLLEALRQIDGDPARYSGEPAHRPQFRGAPEQAKQLLDLYRDIIADQEESHKSAPRRLVLQRRAG